MRGCNNSRKNILSLAPLEVLRAKIPYILQNQLDEERILSPKIFQFG
jgi:hypothetical protein